MHNNNSIVIMDGQVAQAKGIKPLAKIKFFADA